MNDNATAGPCAQVLLCCNADAHLFIELPSLGSVIHCDVTMALINSSAIHLELICKNFPISKNNCRKFIYFVLFGTQNAFLLLYSRHGFKPMGPTVISKPCMVRGASALGHKTWFCDYLVGLIVQTKCPKEQWIHVFVYCISHYFCVQLLSRFWTRCGKSRVVNFAIFLMLSLL